MSECAVRCRTSEVLWGTNGQTGTRGSPVYLTSEVHPTREPLRFYIPVCVHVDP